MHIRSSTAQLLRSRITWFAVIGAVCFALGDITHPWWFNFHSLLRKFHPDFGDVPTWLAVVAAATAAIPAYRQLRQQGSQLEKQGALVSAQIEQLQADINERRQKDAINVAIRATTPVPDARENGFRAFAQVDNFSSSPIYYPVVTFTWGSYIESAEKWSSVGEEDMTTGLCEVLYAGKSMKFCSPVVDQTLATKLVPTVTFRDRFGLRWWRDTLDQLEPDGNSSSGGANSAN